MRMRLVFGVIVLVWIILLVRIYYISIKSNTYYEQIAEQNAISTKSLVPVRGSILDAKGKPMAVNRLGFSIEIAPHLSSKHKIKYLDRELEFLKTIFTDIDIEKLKKTYIKNDSPYNQNFVSIVDFVSYDDMIPHFSKLSLRENLLIEPASKRFYPYDSLASHIIGYVGKANTEDMKKDPMAKLTKYTGRAGAEKYYNQVLQGVKGIKETKVTALNQEVEQVSLVLPKSSDIVLSVDLELQKYITEIFENDAGAAIVMDLEDGGILAAGSFPEYNLNPFVTGISFKEWEELSNNLEHPFTNKLVNGLYPPGSVVKMGVAMAFLNSGKINKNTEFICSGSMELGGRKFRCWKHIGHGVTNLNKALRESCDDYFYKASLKVGIDNIAPVLEKLGFGGKTGIDLPNEFVGTVPSPIWKMDKYNQPWYQGETLITSIGQGKFLVTPMQLAKHTAIIATGKALKPHIIKKIDSRAVKFYPNDILSKFEKSQLPFIRKAMYEVANSPKGTAYRRLEQTQIEVAAKTGTAQVVGIPQNEKKRMKEEDMTYFTRSHSWLTTFGPYEKPKFVVTVLVEHGGHKGTGAGPIVTKIYNKLFELGYIDEKFKKKK